MRIIIQLAGDTQLDRELLRVGAYASDAEPAFRLIGELLIRETKEQFATEGRHGSGGWKPLRPSTRSEKEKHGFPLKILQRTGSLLDSLTVEGDANMIFDARPQELVFGTRVPYAGFHQRGTSRMPQRRPLELTETTRRTAVKLLQRYVMTGELP